MLNIFLKSELYSKNLAYGRHWISRPRGPIQWTLEYKKIWFLTRGGGGFGHYLIILTMGGRWVRPISYFGFKLKSYANIPSIQIDRVEFIHLIFRHSNIVSWLFLAVWTVSYQSPGCPPLPSTPEAVVPPARLLSAQLDVGLGAGMVVYRVCRLREKRRRGWIRKYLPEDWACCWQCSHRWSSHAGNICK